MNKDTIKISAICPVRSEAENIKNLSHTFRNLGAPTELIFVEGGSSDNSWQIIKELDQKKNKNGVLIKAFKQIGKGKAEAVVTGFNKAQGHYLIIVDADMTVPHKDLKKILSLYKMYGDEIIACGNRLKGLPKPKAFYWINYVGNYFFRYYYSLILKTNVRDISCGSKSMTKETWKKVKKLRSNEGPLDSWGDIDWLYYGKKTGQELRFIDVEYTERLAGESKLQNLWIRYRFALEMFLIGLKIRTHSRHV